MLAAWRFVEILRPMTLRRELWRRFRWCLKKRAAVSRAETRAVMSYRVFTAIDLDTRKRDH